MDVLAEILASLRLTGGVVIDGEFRGAFCVRSQFTPEHCAPFFPMPERLIGYHFVRSGNLLVEIDSFPPVLARAGSIVFLPRNDPHLLTRRRGLRPMPAEEVGWVTEGGMHKITVGKGETSRLWCGFLGTAAACGHPLLDALPPLLAIQPDTTEARWLERSLRFVAEEAPSAEVVARLAELFLAEAVRASIATLPESSTGWLAGLADPVVARGLSCIHRRFAEELDLALIAREAGVSRTILGQRFSAMLGQSPMRYCAKWRMRRAAAMLRERKDSTANIAFDVGFNSEAAFNRAFKREYGAPPITWRNRLNAEARQAQRPAAVPMLPPQEVRYCSAHDGTRLAWSAVGEGPPLVKTANWLNHIEHDWGSPIWRHWIREFTQGHCLVRYDERGNGLSDWDTPELSLDAFVDDLGCVVDCRGIERFDLMAISQGAAVAVCYAVRHPERVRRLVICNGFAAGWRVRADLEEVARREAMLTLTEIGWGSDNAAYRQLFTSHYVPDATHEQMDWFNEMQRLSASPENAVKLQRTLGDLDVRALLPHVRTPTLIFHSRHDHAVPFSQGEELACNMPRATFVPLESRNHILLEDEGAWAIFAGRVRRFLASDMVDECRTHTI